MGENERGGSYRNAKPERKEKEVSLGCVGKLLKGREVVEWGKIKGWEGPERD